MNTICILVVLCLCVANGDESCDRKEMEDTICSLCSQRKGNQSGTKLTTSTIYHFILLPYNFIEQLLISETIFIYNIHMLLLLPNYLFFDVVFKTLDF